MNPIIKERMTARMDGSFVVFLIGMRINKPLQVNKWMPGAMAMPRMIRELEQKPEAQAYKCLHLLLPENLYLPSTPASKGDAGRPSLL